MKKSVVSLGLGLAIAMSAVAAPKLDSAVRELNAEIQRLLTPYQNQSTKAVLNFRSIKTDAVRATEVKLNALYKKVGTQNKVEVKIDDVSYVYGKNPTTKVKGSLGIDITKVMPQEQLNEIIPGVEKMVQDMAKDMAREYGDAATVSVKVTEKKTDAAGNFTSIKATLAGKIDLKKLPADVKVEDVLFTSANAALSVDLKQGISFNVSVVSNPEYKGFRQDQKGLKEMLEKLLARDAAQLKEIEDMFKGLNEMAGRIVDGQMMR